MQTDFTPEAWAPRNRHLVAELAGRSFIYTGDPGDHTFSIQSEATDTMEIDAGEVCFVKETLGMGVIL